MFSLLAIFLVCGALGEHQPPESCAGETCAPDEDGVDTQVLLQTTATTVTDDVCPSDAVAEATAFWKKFFNTQCRVDWDADVPAGIKNDVGASAAFRPEKKDGSSNNGCRIVTSLADIGGTIAFDTAPPQSGALTSEGWVSKPTSAVRQMNVGGHEKETDGKQVCEIFHDGILRMVDIPGEKINGIFEQIKADHARDCKVTDVSGALMLATDTSKSDVVAKRSMADSSGRSLYSFVLSVSAPGKDDMDIKVWAEEDPTTDSDSTINAANKAFQELVKRKAEKEDSKADIKKGGKGLIEYGDFADMDYAEPLNLDDADAASYIQGRVRVSAMSPTDSEEDSQSDSEGLLQDQESEFDNLLVDGMAPSAPARVLGKFRVLDDRTSPLLCCLCGSCPDKNACTQGADGLKTPASFIEDDDEDAKILKQERLYPELSPNLLLQVGTASAGSKEENHPPVIPGDVVMPSDFRVRAEPEYGDNFHSLILPRRTAEDHKQVWAQSRALIELAKAEGVRVPKSYHFYDHQDTAKCFQPAYNQGKCGSCWSFASLGALEKQICLRAKGDVKASLSREMLVRCSEQNNGCGGGNADKAYEDLMEIGGVFSTDCLPYQGEGSKHCPVFAQSWFGQGSAGKTGKFARIDQELQKSCKDHTRYSNRPPQGREWDMPFRMMYEARFGGLPNMKDARLVRFKKNFAKSRARDRVPSWWLYGQEAMKTAITKYGSLYASFKVRDDFKKRQCPDGCWPPGTVYGEEAGFKPATCGCGKGHAVHIVGFGEDIQETGTKVPYWLIENSWGQEHGNVFGEDSKGAKGFGLDPFTEEHPMGIEDKCLLAGWAYSLLPKTGGCGGNANLNIRKDVKMTGGKPDGMYLSVKVDNVGVGNWSIRAGTEKKFALNLSLTPGAHKVTFMVYAKDHPKQQSFPIETYGIMATSLRCRGRGYRYSFTQNDSKAKLSWGRKTRKELKEEADKLVPGRNDPEYLYGKCEAACRTGKFSWVKPCLGLLSSWGSCYTDAWAMKSSYMLARKKAMCTPCNENEAKVEQKAYAVKSLNRATFLKWFKLVEESWTAPDDPGWMRANTGSCKIKGGGFVQNALLSATYDINMPGSKFCDERHSAPYAKGKFVHAPGMMKDGEKKPQRCPPPMIGQVSLQCRNGALYALSNTCSLRPGAPDSMVNSTGYYKTLRGTNYHGIESGAAFAIAEMNRFANRCPTLSWTRWSECNVTTPCASGMQHRSRAPIGLSKTDPKCANMMFHEERTCVGPGFCPQVLTRFVASGSKDIATFQKLYKRQSNTMSANKYATAGVTMMSTAHPKCTDAQYWCKITTGKPVCDMYMEGHFEVKKTAEYYLHYEFKGGGGILEFNTLGAGSETKPQFQVRGGSDSSMHEWQDLGFHHRRRRAESKPWERISSMKLAKGTYYARMTRSDWTVCPTYKLKLEQLSAVYRAPLLLGARTKKTAAAFTKRPPAYGGGSKQKSTTWWNNWGAIGSWYKKSRGKYGSSLAPLKETGALNELVLRNQAGGKVIKRVPITKLNFTADELYKLVGINRRNPPKIVAQYAKFELVLRNTIILPEKGEYVFKFQIDTSFDKKNQDWQQSSRRRQTMFHIRVGANPSTGRGAAVATFSSSQGSATKSVSFRASKAGTVPFEASIRPSLNAPGDKAVLPNMVLLEVKRKDTLHGDSINIGSQTKYMSDLTAIRGDQDARIDWPERDDPLSSELKTQTFRPLKPQTLLIGNTDLAGFQALAEVKIDAGACTSLEAWASGVNKNSRNVKDFWGVGLNLCDIDGDNQYLELVTYHPPTHKGTNNSHVRVGWVHVGFTQPCHLRITRDPLDLGKFKFAYRPDNRAQFATPFQPVSSGFTGKMEAGVSMNSAESYRYAEFYNVLIEECPASCKDAKGEQLSCGDITTPCGNKLKCSSSCANGGVCNDQKCMKCPSLKLTAAQRSWDCGTLQQHCTNPKQQKIQVVRDVGNVSQPSLLHFCNKQHKWFCVGQSKWAFLAEGKECGTVKDNCNSNVKLFKCHYKNDVCEAHKCKCTPTAFSQTYNCGSAADGCGRKVLFGRIQGRCPTAQRCASHKCCAPKKKSDFPSTYKCGSEPDGCAGKVAFAQSPAVSFFSKAPTKTTSNEHTGQRGIDITPARDITVGSLARGLASGKKSLSTTSRVSIWSVTSKKEIAHVLVGPSATASGGYAWVNLPTPVKLDKDKKYRIVTRVWKNMPDKYTSAYLYGSALSSAFRDNFASFHGLVETSKSSGFPHDSSASRGQGVGIVNFNVIENGGCGSGAWTCHSNHSCTKQVVKGFLVKSGPCVASGNCVTSNNFGSKHYGNGEKCTILSPSEGTMKAVSYQAEHGYDYLTIDNKRYARRTPPSMKLTAPKTIKWHSDGSVTKPGWKLCVSASLLQEEENLVEQSEEADVDEVASHLDDNQLANLPEDERQHALAKYQQQREEDAAEAEAAVAVEKELAAQEVEADSEPEPFVENDEEEVAEDEEVEMDEDELALPDLTKKVVEETAAEVENAADM